MLTKKPDNETQIIFSHLNLIIDQFTVILNLTTQNVFW